MEEWILINLVFFLYTDIINLILDMTKYYIYINMLADIIVKTTQKPFAINTRLSLFAFQIYVIRIPFKVMSDDALFLKLVIN